MEQAEKILERALAELDGAADKEAVEAWRIQYLGKAGEMTLLVRSIGALPKEERSAAGQAINVARNRLNGAFEERQQALNEAEQAARIARDRVDTSLPGVHVPLGNRHPIQVVLHEIRDIFTKMGLIIHLRKKKFSLDITLAL